MKEYHIRDMYENGGQSDVFREVYNNKGSIIRKERDLTKIQKQIQKELSELHIQEPVSIDDAKKLLYEYMTFQSSVAKIINNKIIEIPQMEVNNGTEIELKQKSYHIKCVPLDPTKTYNAVQKEKTDIKPKIIHYPQAISGEKSNPKITRFIRSLVGFEMSKNKIRFRPEQINKYNILINGDTIYITDLVCDMGQFYVNQHYHQQIEEYNNRRRDIKLSLETQKKHDSIYQTTLQS